jgi:cobalt-zinc-cadmium efflux system membrane fusion protein
MSIGGQPYGGRVVAGVAAVAALTGFFASHWLFPGTSSPKPAPPSAATAVQAQTSEVTIPSGYIASANIAVEAVGSGGIGDEVTASATVAAAPGGEAIVVARASGTISHINRRLGDSVRAGEVLATVDSLDAATMAADRTVASAKATLAKETLDREAALYRQGVTPRQDMEAARSGYEVAQAEAGRARAIVGAAHVMRNGRALAVIAPITGRIASENATVGAFVEPQTELFRIANSGIMQIEASVTATDARRIAPGDAASVRLASGSSIGATVRSVTPAVSGLTQSATVVLTLPAVSRELVVGEGVQVRLKARSSGPSGVIVPEDSVQNMDGHDVLFVRTARGFRAQPVLVGTRSGALAQIISGIGGDERIATHNAFLIKAEMNKNAGGDEE